MNRRSFILLSTALLTQNLCANTKEQITPWQIIDTTLQHIFPQIDNFKGASILKLKHFIQIITQEKSFDEKELEFLIFGAKKLYQREKEFLNLNKQQREITLRNFELEYQNWLSLLLYYGLEGMLGDPIYGGNFQKEGWKALSHNTGLPQPKYKYGKQNV